MMYTDIVHRTQVLLEERQYRALMSLARRTGKGLSQLVREAVDLLVERKETTRRSPGLMALAGKWRSSGGRPGEHHDDVIYGEELP